jgi:hypothetical protein
VRVCVAVGRDRLPPGTYKNMFELFYGAVWECFGLFSVPIKDLKIVSVIL